MPRVNAPVYSLNGGEVGDEGLARLDLERLQFAGSLYSNMLPRVIGSMFLRPGLEHVADINFGDVELLEYSYSGGSSLVPILSNGAIRFLQNNALVTRPSVGTTVTNGDFASFSGWADASTGGATAGVSGGRLVLSGQGFNRASAKQTVNVALADRNVQHGLRVVVFRGPVSLRLGSIAGSENLIKEIVLEDGAHSINFQTSQPQIFIELFNETARDVLVTSCNIDAAGVLSIPAPWQTADITSKIVRYKQHKDVLYAASGIYQQREIRRYSDTAWGIQRYKVNDGPFTIYTGGVQLTNSAQVGNGTLTSSSPYFSAEMVGRLFRLFHSGQDVLEVFNGANQNGTPVRVSGVGSARKISFNIAGTFTATLTLQVATDDGSGNPTAWVDVSTYTTTGTGMSYTDPDNNVIKFFRFVVKTGDYTSGTINTRITYAGGSQSGICRVTAYTSTTVVSIEVLKRFLNTVATSDWDYSTWSDADGWPAAVETFGGRLFWSKGDMAYGSVPDAYNSFDDEVEGASAPIVRSINTSSQRGMLWLLGLQRLIAGTDASEVSIKSSSFDEPLTADSWFPVDASTRGCASIRAVKADKDGIFVQASKTGLFRMAPDEQGLDYSSTDLMQMHEEICGGSEIVDIAVQRRPDTIVWIILANGEARALTYEPKQSVIAWSRIVTDGLFKRVAASRGAGQDSVHFAVVRNGTQRLERLANMGDCRGGALNCLADGFSRFTATSGQTTFSVPHLNGRQVTVWVDGVAVRDQDNLYTVTGNQVVIPAVGLGKSVVIGLPYTGRWKSTKLAYGAANGTALFQKKRIAQLGLYLIKTMLDGLRVGNSFSNLRKFTTSKGDKAIPPGFLWNDFDADMMSISSDWDTDSRICLEARSPYPFTAGSLVMDVKTNG